jgi:hypothetical protein
MRSFRTILASGILCLMAGCASVAFKAGETTLADVEKEWGMADKSILLTDGSKEYYWVVDRHTTISGVTGGSSLKPTVTWRVLVFDADGHFKREGGVKSQY